MGQEQAGRLGGRRLRLAAAVLAIASAFTPPRLWASPDVDLLLCQAVREQEAIEARWREFEYHKEDIKEKLSRGQIVSTTSTLFYIHRLPPYQVNITEVVARNGSPLSAEGQAGARSYVEGRLRELREDPEKLAEAIEERRDEAADKIALLAMSAGAVHARLEGFDFIDQEPCWVISFFPNPDFRSRGRESLFQKAVGVAWVRATDPVFVRLEMDFIDDVSLKLGPLATIAPGSHLYLEQRDVEPGLPLTRVFQLELRLRIVFIGRRYERRTTLYRDFKRVLPPLRALEP